MRDRGIGRNWRESRAIKLVNSNQATHASRFGYRLMRRERPGISTLSAAPDAPFYSITALELAVVDGERECCDDMNWTWRPMTRW